MSDNAPPSAVAGQCWHDVSGLVGSLVVDAVTVAIERERDLAKPKIDLSEAEARVLYTALTRMWAPMAGYAEFKAGVEKLGRLGGGFSCRDCPSLGTLASHYGGFVCPDHKAEEDWRFAIIEDRERNPRENQ